MLVVVGVEILPENWCLTLCQTDVEMEDRIEIGVVVGSFGKYMNVSQNTSRVDTWCDHQKVENYFFTGGFEVCRRGFQGGRLIY